MTTLVDLFEFLSSPNPQARQIALSNLAGHTVKADPQRHIFVPSLLAPAGAGGAGGSGASSGLGGGSAVSADDARKIQGLKDLRDLCRDQATIAHLAFTSLVNLSDAFAVARHLVEDDFLVWLVSYTTNTTSILSPLSSMLLSNISSHPALLPALARLTIPLVPLPLYTPVPTAPDSPYAAAASAPKWYCPAGLSGSSTAHPAYRDPAVVAPNREAGQEDERPVEAVRALVQAFEDGAGKDVAEGKGGRKGECHFLASVFANLSTLPSTRPLLLVPFPQFPAPSSAFAPIPTNASRSSFPAPPEPLLAKIAPFTSHPDTIRRGGALGCIKNIALDRTYHAFLLAGEEDRVRLPPTASAAAAATATGTGVKRDAEGVAVNRNDKDEEDEDEDARRVEEQVGESRTVRGVDVLPAVLGPLMGGEEYDMDEMDSLPPTLQFLPPTKTREADPVLRAMCVDILLLLSTSRETLRQRGTYYVVRELHKNEADQTIKESVERLVNLLQGEEGHQTKEEVVDDLVKGVKAAPEPASASTATATATGANDDDDDDDMDVQEV